MRTLYHICRFLEQVVSIVNLWVQLQNAQPKTVNAMLSASANYRQRPKLDKRMFSTCSCFWIFGSVSSLIIKFLHCPVACHAWQKL